MARGGIYAPGAAEQFGESYLKFLLNFLGIKDISWVRAEGLALAPERRESALREALATAAAPLARAACASL